MKTFKFVWGENSNEESTSDEVCVIAFSILIWVKSTSKEFSIFSDCDNVKMHNVDMASKACSLFGSSNGLSHDDHSKISFKIKFQIYENDHWRFLKLSKLFVTMKLLEFLFRLLLALEKVEINLIESENCQIIKKFLQISEFKPELVVISTLIWRVWVEITVD